LEYGQITHSIRLVGGPVEQQWVLAGKTHNQLRGTCWL